MVTIAIQLDACRPDYINSTDTPFMDQLKKRGVSGSLIPTFGFEPDAAYLAGLYPDECNGGMHFEYSPDSSPFRHISFLAKGMDHSPSIIQRIVRRMLSSIVRWTTKSSFIKNAPHSGRIPFQLLPFFDIAEKFLFTEDDFLQGKSIFTLLKRNHKNFLFHGAPRHNVSSLSVLERVKAINFKYDFIFLHIGDLDSIGHKYGPRSPELISALKNIDVVIKKIWDLVLTKNETINMVLFGDHGMIKVKSLVNIKTGLQKLPLQLQKDYLYFLDSTFARFWFFNDNAKNKIINFLGTFMDGYIIDDKEKDLFHINYSHNRFGDLIFLVNPGRMIFPNFWNITKPDKGMHGYHPEHPEQQSMFIIADNKSTFYSDTLKKVDMRRIFPTLIKLIGLNHNKKIKLKSIV